MVPRVEIANLHDSIPPELFLCLLKWLPDLLGKPFPPEVQPDLKPTAPFEPTEREAPKKHPHPSCSGTGEPPVGFFPWLLCPLRILQLT
jgi:hypothetical protein